MFETEKERERAGFLMRKFFACCELGFRRSRKGTLPGWVAELVGGEPGGGISFKKVPATLFGFRGEEGAVISGWKVGDGEPVLENRTWAALLRLRPLREFWTLELRENHRLQLERMLAQTWVVDSAPVPQHGVIPGLGIQNWSGAPRQLEDGRGLALYLPSPQRGESEIVWGPDADPVDWMAALDRARETFSEGNVAQVQALPDRPETAVEFILE